jgi:outer membrane lipoprotein-sorting protein
MSRKITWMVALTLTVPAGRVAAQEETAKAIIERAIEAHGGEERLARIHASRVRYRGTFFLLMDQTRAFIAETTFQLPSQFKTVIESTTPDKKKHTGVHVINGDKMSMTADGVPQTMDAAQVQDIRARMLINRAVLLVPLLRDRNYQLSVVETVKVNDRPAVGVRVAPMGKAGIELRLYFDKELGLLVKTEYPRSDGAGKVVREEQYFGNFKDDGGYKRPYKFVVEWGGKKIMEAEITDVKNYSHLDDNEFNP